MFPQLYIFFHLFIVKERKSLALNQPGNTEEMKENYLNYHSKVAGNIYNTQDNERHLNAKHSPAAYPVDLITYLLSIRHLLTALGEQPD